MSYKYVSIELENHKATTSELKGHHEIIEEYSKNGFEYCGYIPTLYGSSGKVLRIELIFKSND
ncbi:MAG: DUF4177 domain-containing protein [Ruminococcus sp.]|nr:DUF4177 domain-containing protein [Ruminococcus sp.]